MSDKTASRWSVGRYNDLEIPTYIPSEALLHEHGQFLRAFLLRVLVTDLQRLLTTNGCEQCFVNAPLTPEYDSDGNRSNTPEAVISERRMRAMDDIGKLLRAFVDRAEQAKSQEITRRIYLTPELMSTGAWGAIIGARGMVHQQLEKETKCRIVLVGRDITNPLKDTNANAAAMALEDPHVRIIAPNEQQLQLAAERIEWILSDDPEAVEFRERNRRRTAQVEGRYDPRTWVSSSAAAAGQPGVGAKRGRTEEAPAAAKESAEEVDAELDELLEDL